ncbi:MAG: hypothetical protein JXK94_13195 [Deltaproteobacteria bacterium]|nr:hypothetical protein [Deltaproteobacteria bacterium]
MIDEKLFSEAVALTAAFISNGDIRCNESFREDSKGMTMVRDMITTSYNVLQDARDDIDHSES